MPISLTPQIPSANATIDVANVPNFLIELIAFTPLPIEKNATQIAAHHVVKNRNGTYTVTVQFDA
jgi:hypothetical protein